MAFWKRLEVAVTASLATTGEIDLREWEGCRIELGAGITSLTFYESDRNTAAGGVFDVANGSSAGTPIAMTGLTAGQTYLMPTELNASHWLKIVANTSGTIVLMLKKVT